MSHGVILMIPPALVVLGLAIMAFIAPKRDAHFFREWEELEMQLRRTKLQLRSKSEQNADDETLKEWLA